MAAAAAGALETIIQALGPLVADIVIKRLARSGRLNKLADGIVNNLTDEQLQEMIMNGFNNGEPMDMEKEIAKYRRTNTEKLIDNLLPTLSKGIKTVGNVWGNYHGLLGNALMAVTNGVQSQGYDNPFFMAPAYSSGVKFRGDTGQQITDAVGDALVDISNDLKFEKEKEKETALLLNHKVPALAIDDRRKLTRIGNATNDARNPSNRGKANQ